ncbi:MAG: CopG family transcriptional regulator [Candidatus Rokuibacteriota bacterium]|nr:MAG: CopG family transcriptional regulator [Candidatus Rokubacteria bacterium]
MRTTITLDRDVAQAIHRLRRQRGIGLSEAVNDLIRAGLRARAPRPAFRQRVHSLGLKIDVRNVADALEILDGPASR